MKLLLDECVNQKFRLHLIGHDAVTVGFLRWDGIQNGALLRAAAANGFDAMLTIDRAMPDQHNAATLPLTVIVLTPATDQLQDLIALLPALSIVLADLPTRAFVFVP